MKSAIPIIHGHIIKPTAHARFTYNSFKYTNAENIICTDAGTKLNNNIDLKEQLMLFRAMTNADILHHRESATKRKMVERNTNMKIWVAGTTLKSEYRTHLNIMKTIAPPNVHDALQLMSEQNAIVFFCVLQCWLHVILIARLMLGQDNGKSEVLPNAKARSMPHRRMQAI